MMFAKQGLLSDFFKKIAVKQLSRVETDKNSSNQHEFNGSLELRQFFGDDDRRDIATNFIWLGGEQDSFSETGRLSWYDARRKHRTRTEYRLYFTSNSVTASMNEGDALFIAEKHDDTILVIIAPASGTFQSQLLWLFGLILPNNEKFNIKNLEDGTSSKLDFASRYILDELGIDPSEPDCAMLDRILAPLKGKFPSTEIFSRLARESIPSIRPNDNPDDVLLAWIEREDRLFRRLERHIVEERINQGFVNDVDGFISFSLSVQNRRKSRAGRSLENHLREIFCSLHIKFDKGAETENRNRPDFLFPGSAFYTNPKFLSKNLTMLGAKSTCKERWRQVLSEAERIKVKHLLTLEPAISQNQTDEMQTKHLQLVLPAKLHKTYNATQQNWLMTLEDFISLVRHKQTLII